MPDDLALPAPLVPPDADLRGYDFMPLLVQRLIDSDFWALSSGDECKAALTLWCKAWTQIPAGSLPDDDKILAHLSGAGQKWSKVKAMALRGWGKCSDGRLHHSVLSGLAADAWEKRQKSREKRDAENDRLKRWRKKRETQDETRFETARETHIETSLKRVGEGEGQREGKEESSLRSDSPRPPPAPADRGAGGKPVDLKGADLEAFEGWWAVYPQKVGKGAARRAYAAALRKGVTHQVLADGLARASPGMIAKEERYRPHAATWLNQERWLDQPGPPAPRETTMNDIVDSVFGVKPETKLDDDWNGPVIDGDLVYETVDTGGPDEWDL